ncbi:MULTISPECIES: VOC family protein [Tsukamurella]|uniref:VOC family protein n=2 Tax=Tsukamurella TaxID=2060 RepID=A0A5C5S573_9ACTN|nr:MULTISPECIES: VOC family protein [Tsukamurella]NMD55397.1 VOC family protein [Tsukamurella columbiensis]TWS30646.1 VOC family protein [Tsukamurella conjunctivitidis]
MAPPRFRQVVLDAADARRSAEFYRAFLGLDYLPGDEPRAGVGDPDFIVLTDADGRRLLAFQTVPAFARSTWPSMDVPQQLHLDFAARDLAEMAEQHDRVLALGGSLVDDRIDDPEEALRVYADLDGHPFCIFVAEQ